ncbi:aspartate kinase homoserine dehydrogenase [Phanerochaete sordida]|uniref:Homoserine dehydrogenase n=1 Tax=Phanerochaete sordida TaxID=48140 RepID=A0A9P3FZZ4_9APHY|nr:aspartate kinase homoserine dehydrogenase [Phanerochaete sordida]
MPRKPTLSVAIVGVGLVGSELISQLLALPAPSPFRLVSLTSSKYTLFAAAGLPVDAGSWATALSASRAAPDLHALLEQLAGLEAAVLVDNTSAQDVAALYPRFLARGIHVVTPNKKAFSGSQELYDAIERASAESGARWLNESTVGAGLPVVQTLKDLVATGDKVKKIEGVFSGTMSYIFNNFSTASAGGPSFSSVVRVAREKGYTEPHPADDLNGADVARKLAILARSIPTLQSALPEGYASVQTRSLVPAALESVANGTEFVEKLPEFDAEFEKLREEALKEGSVLRFVGVVDVENNLVKADLQKYPTTHPFATSLGGSDNIIMFHSERYSPRPLIVQGAGAGAAVTAMGVMSDLLKLVL